MRSTHEKKKHVENKIEMHKHDVLARQICHLIK